MVGMGGKSPDLRGCGGAYPNPGSHLRFEAELAFANAQGNAVGRRHHVQDSARPDAGAVEEFQEAAIAFKHAGYRKALFGEGFFEGFEAAAAAIARRVHANQVAVRAGVAAA